MNNFHSTYKRIKVLTEAGRKNADVELPYNRRGFSIAEISGRIVQADGTVIPFEGKPFDKVLMRGRGIRINVKAFTLPDVQVGSILDVRYRLRYDDNRVLPAEWTVQDDLFQQKASFKFIPFPGGGNVYITLAHGQIANNISWSTFLPAGNAPQQHTALTPPTPPILASQARKPGTPVSSMSAWRRTRGSAPRCRRGKSRRATPQPKPTAPSETRIDSPSSRDQ